MILDILESLLRGLHNPMNTCTWWCTLGGVGTFAKEKVLELMLINLEKKKGILVFSGH